MKGNPGRWQRLSRAAALCLVCQSAYVRAEAEKDVSQATATTASASPAASANQPTSEGLRASSVPPPVVNLVLADASPVIGLAGETLLSISVENPPTLPMPIPRMFCSVGRIEDLSRDGPAKFSARYILPSARFPQPAILVAEFPDRPSPLRGMTALGLRAAATPSFRTDPGAKVTLRVGERDFGPQIAPADGVVHVPVVVPAGVNFAIARSVNQHGKSTEGMVDLHVPYSQRLLFAAPETLVAGTVGEVAVYAVEPSGRPANAAMLELRAGKSRVQPLGSRAPGEARFLVTAPTTLRQKSLRIEAQLKEQSTTRIATRIALLPGPAADLVLEPEAPRLERKPTSSMRVYLGAADAFGNPVDAGRANVLVDGRPTALQVGTDGEPMVVVRTPESARPGSEVVVEGVLDQGHTFARIPVGPKIRRPSPKLVDVIAYPRFAVTPRVGVLTNFGPLVGATFFVDGFVYPSARDRGLGLGLGLGWIESHFAAQSTGAISGTDLSSFPISFHLRQHWAFGRAFVGVSASAGFAISVMRVHSFGVTTVGRSYGGMAEVGAEGGLLFRRAHLLLAFRYLGLYLSDFSSGDRLPGNAGGAVMDVGYRLVW